MLPELSGQAQVLAQHLPGALHPEAVSAEKRVTGKRERQPGGWGRGHAGQKAVGTGQAGAAGEGRVAPSTAPPSGLRQSLRAALVEPDLVGGASSPLGTLVTAGLPWRPHLLMSPAETKPTE